MGANNTPIYPPGLSTPASGSGGNFDPSANIAFTGQDSFSNPVELLAIPYAANHAATLSIVDSRVAAAINAVLSAYGFLIVYKELTAAAPLDFSANFYKLFPTAPTTYTFIAMDSQQRVFRVKNYSNFEVTLTLTGGLIDGQPSVTIPGATSGPYFGYTFVSEGANLNTE